VFVLERSGSQEGKQKGVNVTNFERQRINVPSDIKWFRRYNGTLYTLEPTYFIELLQPAAVSYQTRGSAVAEAPRVSGTLHWRLMK